MNSSSMDRALTARTGLDLARALLLLACVALFGPASAQSGGRTPGREIDRVVAIVNDDVILLSEMAARIRTVRGQMQQSGARPPPVQVLEQQVLDRMILERLQLQIAERTGIRVDDEGLNRAVANIARGNQLKLAEFRQILERDGYDFAKFRDDVRRQIIISQVQRRFVGNRVRVRRKEIDNYLASRGDSLDADREYRVFHILIAVPDGASDEQRAAARERAQGLIEELRAGADFAAMAAKVSEGPTAAEGGDLGWRKADRLPSILLDVVPRLNKGDVAGPIESGSGFNIVKLEDVRGDENYVVTQTLAQQILIVTNELTSDEDARTRLAQLRERISQGASFAELARANSDDKASAVKDGRLGWVNPGDLVPEFERAMNALAPMEISPPFKSAFGWHIVQVLDRREYDNTEQVRRAKAREKLRARRVNEELETWLRRLRDEAYVELKLDR